MIVIFVRLRNAMSNSPRVDYSSDFEKDLKNIDKLEQTAHKIKEIAIQALEKAIWVPGLPTTVKMTLENNRDVLKNIHDESIKENFRVIYLQMCVLAVSSLEATLKKYFENALNDFNKVNPESKGLKGATITLVELAKKGLSYRSGFGTLVLEKIKPNFQDLKSIKSNFKDYLSKDINLGSEIEKKICFYLELRHVLVHKGGVVDKKFVDATDSFGANIKNYGKDDRVEIDSSDWTDIKQCFSQLVKDITRYE